MLVCFAAELLSVRQKSKRIFHIRKGVIDTCQWYTYVNIYSCSILLHYVRELYAYICIYENGMRKCPHRYKPGEKVFRTRFTITRREYECSSIGHILYIHTLYVTHVIRIIDVQNKNKNFNYFIRFGEYDVADVTSRSCIVHACIDFILRAKMNRMVAVEYKAIILI